MTFDQVVEAIPLITPEPRDGEHFAVKSSRRGLSSKAVLSNTVLVATLLISLFSLLWGGLNLFSSVRPLAAPLRTVAGGHGKVLDGRILRRPSLYLGLDRVPRIKASLEVESLLHAAAHTASPEHQTASTGSTAVEHHHNNPPALPAVGSGPVRAARVNSRYPSQRFPQDQWMLLTEQDQMIMEFQPVLDGSNKCAFASYFPPRRDLGDKLLTIENDDASSEYPLVQFAPISREIPDLAALTWDMRPPTGNVLEPVTAAFGANSTTEAFICIPSRPVLVELSCLGRGCRIEYKIEDGTPRLGIELVQL